MVEKYFLRRLGISEVYIGFILGNIGVCGLVSSGVIVIVKNKMVVIVEILLM